MNFDIKEAEKRIKYTFKDKELLVRAFTHSSYSNRHNTQSYERLEFLGDAVLGFVIASELYKKHGDYDDGRLSKEKSRIVNNNNIRDAALALKLNDFLLLGGGQEEASGKIVADLLESVAGAIYIDGGLSKAAEFIKFALKDFLGEGRRDYVTEFMLYCQKNYGKNAKYKVIKQEGPPHKPIYTMAAEAGGTEYPAAVSGSKKEAKRLAAKNALEKLKS